MRAAGALTDRRARRDCGERVRGRDLTQALRRLVLSMGASFYVRVVTRLPLSDCTGGFKAWNAEALKAIGMGTVASGGYSFQIEMTHRLWRQGFTVAEVPIIFTERTEGQSKMAGGIINEAFWMVWWLWLQNGMRRSPRDRVASPRKNP